MKMASLIVAVALALASGAPARPTSLPDAAVAAGSVAQRTSAGTASTSSTRQNDDAAPPSAPGPSTYLLLALGLFGMGLVSRRRQAD